MKIFGTAVMAGMTAILLGMAPAALAQGRWGHRGGGFQMLLEAANLTSSQKAQVHEIMKSNWQQSKSDRTQIQALRAQIADKLASTGPVTVSDITAIQAQIAQVHAQAAQHWAETAIQVRSVLTADQLKRVSQVHQQLESLRAQMKAVVKGAAGAQGTQVDPAEGYGEGTDEGLEVAPPAR